MVNSPMCSKGPTNDFCFFLGFRGATFPNHSHHTRFPPAKGFRVLLSQGIVRVSKSQFWAGFWGGGLVRRTYDSLVEGRVVKGNLYGFAGVEGQGLERAGTGIPIAYFWL